MQQYVYNLNDLNELYNTIKEYGIQTCDYFVKYEIVKNMEEPVTLEVTLTPYAFEMLCGGLYYDNDNYYKENPNKAVNELISEFGEYMVD